MMLFSQQYQQLPTVDKDTEERESFHKDNRKRRFYLHAIATIAIMWASFTATRTITSKGFWAACRGSQRNSSTLAQLPSHYTLPSGDKIPSVALGRSPKKKHPCDKLTLNYTGVWQASKGEVGNAVKASIIATGANSVAYMLADRSGRRLQTHRRSLDLSCACNSALSR